MVRIATGLFVFLALVLPSPGVAADVAVSCELTDVENVGDTLVARATMTVANSTAGEIKNVDLRLDAAGINALIQRVMQVGSIPASEVRIGSGLIRLDPDSVESGEPLIWRIDYDGAGTHHATTVGVKCETL